MNVFAGKPLRYLIANDDAPGVEGSITEPGYAPTSKPIGIALRYGNLRDQVSPLEMRKRNEGNYGPYLPPDDISEDYPEPAPVARSDGAWRLIDQQIDAPHWDGIEWDNIDTYKKDPAYIVEILDRTWAKGLPVAIKNPLNMEGDKVPLIKHPATQIAIVEKGAGSPAAMYALLKAANKFIPVRYVARESEKAWAQEIAQAILAGGYPDFAVTWSPEGEYAGVQDILLPTPSTAQAPMPQVTGADIIAKAKTFIGKLTDGPDVPMMTRAIAAAYPDMANYAAIADDKTAWCAIFVAYVCTLLGIRPPYIKDSSDTNDFMWADAPLEANWGTVVNRAQAQPGDVMVLSSPHHQTIFDGNDGTSRFWGVGGNQGSGVVSRASFAWSGVRAVVRPPVAAAVVSDTPEIQEGATGAAVTKLQVLLVAQGYNIGPDGADGEFGPDTALAVKKFQGAKGLEVDGVVGDATWAVLLGGTAPTAPLKSGKGSWYSQYNGKYEWVDKGDKPGSSALGVPDDAQGISFYDQATKGKWFEVVAPNGVKSIEQQTDIGPSPSTGRLIDISAAAAERFGYSPANFPTDGIFYWRQIAVPSVVAGLSAQQQATKYRDLRGSLPPTPTIPEPPEPEPPVVTPEPPATKEEAYARVYAALDQLKALDMATQPATPQIDWAALLGPLVKQLLPSLLPLIIQLLPSLLPLLLKGLTGQTEAKSTTNTAVVAGSSAVGGGIITAIITALAQGFFKQ